MSVCRVEHAETYDNGRPRMNGLLDPRMGSVDRNRKCLTCQESMNDCVGHFGHVDLQRPVFHTAFMARCKKILESVCHACSQLKCDVTSAKFLQTQQVKNPQARLRAVWELCKGRHVCSYTVGEQQEPGGCGAAQYQLKRNGLEFIGSQKTQSQDTAPVFFPPHPHSIIC